MSKKILAVAAAAALVAGLAGCSGGSVGSTSAGAAADGSPLSFAYVPKALNIGYFNAAEAGAMRAAEELGVDLKSSGPTTIDPSSQIPFINTLAQQKTDVVLLAANDPDAVVPALEQAGKRGTRFVTFDADAAGGRAMFVNQATFEDVAATQVKLISDQLGGTGQIAILSGSNTSPNQNTWVELMQEELKKPEYAGLELVKVAYGDSTADKTTQETLGLLQQFPDLKGIIVPDVVGLPTAAQVIDSKGLSGTVKLTGVALPSAMREFVKSGTVESFSLWDVDKLGYLTMYAGYALATGEVTGAEGETFDAGDMGTITIGADGEIELGTSLVLDSTNIDDYDF
jgi:rhamnose transport system substrate-binding protein